MQGYTWSSNQHQQPPPQYERFPQRYQDVRNEAQFNGQFYNNAQARYSNGKQVATNQRNNCSYNNVSLGPGFQPNSHGYDRQTNWTHPQSRSIAFNTQQQYPSENSNAHMYQGTFRTQSYASPPQNYRNTGHCRDGVFWSPQSNYGGSVGNSRGWSNHMSNNGSSCQMNNQQQIQRITPGHHRHHLQQQWASRRHKKQNVYQSTQGQSFSSGSNKSSNNTAQSQTAACYTSGNFTNPPSEAQSHISIPSNNLNQSHVNQDQTELKSNADPVILATQSLGDHNAGNQSQSINNVTSQISPTTESQSLNNEVHNVFQTSQIRPTTESQSLNNEVHNVFQTSQIRPTTESQSLNNEVHNVYQTSQIRPTTESQSLNNEVHNVNQTSQIMQTIETQSLNKGIYIVNQTSPIRKTSETQSLNNGIYNIILISQTTPTNEAQSNNSGTYEVIQISQASSEPQSTNNGIFKANHTSQTKPTDESQNTNNGIYYVNQSSEMRLTNEAQSTNNGNYNINQTTQTTLDNEAKTTNNRIYEVNQPSQTKPTNKAQSLNNGIYVDQNPQIRSTNKVQHQPHSKYSKDSLIYKLLMTEAKAQGNMQQSNENISNENTCSEWKKICATNRIDNHSKEPFSAPSAQCPVEPPSKRIKYGVVQRDYWNKEAGVSTDRRDLSGVNSQRNIQYSTDPADCLEAVFALQKAAQHSHKAIAIVPPISQQIPNATQIENPKNADSSQLKIDCVWSLPKESDAQITINDKLPESPSQTKQQDDKSVENDSAGIADPDTCSTSPVQCQNDVQQSDIDVGESSFDLSTVPLIKYTLENLKDLVKSLEVTQLAAGYPEQSKSVLKTILDLYWNGDHVNIVKPFKVFRNEMMQYAFLKDIIKDSKFVVFESIGTENLKKLAHCDILNDEMYSLSEEFRSSWLNVDGSPDIEKVLSEPLTNYITVSNSVSQSFSNNTGAISTTLGVKSFNDLLELSCSEKNLGPDESSPTDLFTPQPEYDTKEKASENNGHSYVIKSLGNISNDKEIHKELENNNQNPTKPSDFSPSAFTDKETSRQDQSGQAPDNVSLSDSLSDSHGGNVSDGVKSSEVSLSTKTLCNSTYACQIEDISDDENPVNKEALNNSAETWLVEDISDDDNPVNKEALNNSADTWKGKDISEEENQISKDTQISPDMCVVEDVLNDEYSSDDSVLMEITVLSSEDAKTLYQQLEEVPKCTIQTSESDFDSLESATGFDVSKDFKHEHKANTCFRCSKMVQPNTTSVFRTDTGDHLCPQCWEQAPLLQLFCPSEKDADILTVKSDEQGQNCCSPNFKQNAKEQPVASIDEGQTGQSICSMVKSDLGDNCSPPSLPSPFPELEVTEPTVTVTAECTAHDEGLTGQKRDFMVTQEKGQNCSLTSNELEVKESHDSSPETCVAEELLPGQKSDSVVKSDLGPGSPAHLELQEPADASSEACMENEHNHISQLLGLQDKGPTVASTEGCIERLAGQKSHSETTAQLEQNLNPPCLQMKVNETNFASPEPTNETTKQKCISGNNKSRQRNDSMVKLMTKLMPKTKRSTKQGSTKTKPNEKTKKISLQCNKPHPSSAYAGTELFAPDIVVKNNCPQNKNVPVVSSNKRPGGESLNCNKVKKFKRHRQASQDRTSLNHRKVPEKVPDHSKEMPVHRYRKKPELHSIRSMNEDKTMKPKIVKFDLYGSKREKQCYSQERRFSAPATLTISDSCHEYNDVLSAKQKVHNLWSSTFIPKTKTTRREVQMHEEGSPQKKKPQKPQDVLKSSMSGLKSRLTQRAILLASSEKTPSHFRKKTFQQKLTKTLSV